MSASPAQTALAARELERLLEPVIRRLAAAAAGRWLVRALAAAAGGLLAWALATAIVPVPFPLLHLLPWTAGAVLAVGVTAGRLCRPSLFVAARIADSRAGLADRLGTAVDLLARFQRPAGFARLQIRDALAAAAGLDARAVAPIRVPKDAGLAIALCIALGAWAVFGAGLALPGTPAGRMVATIHREGRVLVDVGRRLDETARAGQLPAALRTAPTVQETGRRLEAPRVGYDDAIGRVREVVRQLQTAQDSVRRQIDQAMSSGRGARPGTGAAGDEATRRADQAQRLDAARLALEDLAGALRQGSSSAMSQRELARRLAALSDSLDQLGAPSGVRAGVDRARRAAESGQRGAAQGALGDALQDLQGLERMLGDEQALGDARRQAQRSADRIARAARGGGSAQSAQQSGSDTTSQAAPGSNPVRPGGEESTPPPPGPNQGSLAGKGTGPGPGAPTPRLGGTRTQSRLQGLSGPGSTQVREIVGPGRAAPSQRAAVAPPGAVAREIDRALSQDPLPADYVTLIRRYFDTLGGNP